MFSQHLQSVEWLNIFGIAAMFLFFFLFFAVVIWIWRLDKDYLKESEKLPLED